MRWCGSISISPDCRASDRASARGSVGEIALLKPRHLLGRRGLADPAVQYLDRRVEFDGRLRFADGRCETLLPPYQRLRFAGEDELTGELVDGPSRDFNLMWRRDDLHAELLHRPLVGSMLFFCEPQAAWAIHLLAGQAAFEDPMLPPLQAGDTAWLGAGERRRHALHGGGELLAIRVTPAADVA